jgi:hypothetical protein
MAAREHDDPPWAIGWGNAEMLIKHPNPAFPQSVSMKVLDMADLVLVRCKLWQNW